MAERGGVPLRGLVDGQRLWDDEGDVMIAAFVDPMLERRAGHEPARPKKLLQRFEQPRYLHHLISHGSASRVGYLRPSMGGLWAFVGVGAIVLVGAIPLLPLVVRPLVRHSRPIVRSVAEIFAVGLFWLAFNWSCFAI